MKIYVRKIDNQFITKQVSYTHEILTQFLDDVKDGSRIRCEGLKSKHVENVQILLATDPRFNNDIKKILSSEGNFQIDDLMLMHKQKTGYIIELVTKTDTRYKSYWDLFGNQRHLVMLADDYVNEINQVPQFKVYGMHIKDENSALDENNPHICIGWSDLGDLSVLTSKNELKNLFSATWAVDNARSVGQQVGQIWRFVHEMQIGDYVVFGDGNTAHIGKITSDYFFGDSIENQSPDYKNNRSVAWLAHIKYAKLAQSFKHSLGSAMSIFSLNEYKSYVLELIDGKYDVEEEPENEDLKGENVLYYGVPGCGKSYYVEHIECASIDDEFKERVTFHPDYTYGDFVGQLLPSTDVKGNIRYAFEPGPFTNILKMAYENRNKQCVLIIEEINRGNAAAIFGDLFQLLDRSNGASEYGITNADILNELQSIGYTKSKIYIPRNLYIYATMNTSDQNVFVLDTAFKRRWKQQLIANDIESCGYKDVIIKDNISWGSFCKIVNAKIANLVEKQICEEDKMLGSYFVKHDEIDNVEIFASKVLSYLWNDVVKYNRSEIFNTTEYKIFSDVLAGFKTKGFKIFNLNELNLVEAIDGESDAATE